MKMLSATIATAIPITTVTRASNAVMIRATAGLTSRSYASLAFSSMVASAPVVSPTDTILTNSGGNMPVDLSDEATVFPELTLSATCLPARR